MGKRIITQTVITLSAIPVFADDVGITSISSASDGISNYMPLVRMLCFALAGIVAIVGAYYTYYAIHTGEEVRKHIMVSVGGAIIFVAMALGLPKFFGYNDNGFDTTGLIASNSSSMSDTSTSSMSGDGQGVPGGGIKTDIPDPSDPSTNYYQELSSKDILTQTGLLNSSLDKYSCIDYRDVMDREGDYSSDVSYRMMDDAWNYIVKCDFDFEKAYNMAVSDYEACSLAEASGDSWPWKSSEYMGVADAISDLGNALWNSLPPSYRQNVGSAEWNYYFHMFN